MEELINDIAIHCVEEQETQKSIIFASALIFSLRKRTEFSKLWKKNNCGELSILEKITRQKFR